VDKGADLQIVIDSQKKRYSCVSKVKKLEAAKASGDAEAIKEAQTALDEALARQEAEVQKVHAITEQDKVWRSKLQLMEKAKKERGVHNKEVGAAKKAKDEDKAAAAMKKAEECKAAVDRLDKEEKAEKVVLDGMLRAMGNLLHSSVPDNDDEDDPALADPSLPTTNVHKMHGDCTTSKKYNHVDLMRMLDMMDVERGTNVAGGRGYFLRGDGVLLNQAIIQLALCHLSAKGYTPLQTPFFMKRDMMAKCAQLDDFDEALYKVVGNEDDPDEEKKYLIATSEQPICCYHAGEKLDTKQFPIRYAGYSTCFRKEAGKHGRDTLGVFRTHQFEKVEQFVLCTPEGDESWKEMDRMLESSMEFYKALEIPFRVVNIVSGELNDAAAKKYDLEAWFPGGKAFRELVSCSNCTDYQSRRVDCRFGEKSGADFCHMLNSTLSACERTMCCLVENYQTEDGLLLPEVLWPFMGGRKVIKFKFGLNSKGNLEPLNKPAPSAGPTQQEAPKKTEAKKEAPKKQEAKKEAPKKEEPKKKEPKKKESKKKEKETKEPTPEELAKAAAKKEKAVIKEGGKKGVEIEGACDMGGMQFFCTQLDEPDGDMDLLEKGFAAMNAEADPTEEERKGGAGGVGKVVFSAGSKALLMICNVPEDKLTDTPNKEEGQPPMKAVAADKWLKSILGKFAKEYPGAQISEGSTSTLASASLPANEEKRLFPVKLKDDAMSYAYAYLNENNCMPPDDDSDDDYIPQGDFQLEDY